MAAAHSAFSTLAAANLLHYLAVSYVWVSGPERTRALGASEAITATALPVVVFMVASAVAARGQSEVASTGPGISTFPR